MLWNYFRADRGKTSQEFIMHDACVRMFDIKLLCYIFLKMTEILKFVCIAKSLIIKFDYST